MLNLAEEMRVHLESRTEAWHEPSTLVGDLFVYKVCLPVFGRPLEPHTDTHTHTHVHSQVLTTTLRLL